MLAFPSTSLYLGICLLVIKQAFHHPGLFLLEHGIFAITLGIGRCDKAGVFFIDQNFQKLKVSLLHVIAQISSELLGRSFLNELSFLPSQFYLV
jgi:hypothetical protein